MAPLKAPQRQKMPTAPSSLKTIITVGVFYTILAGFAHYRMQWTPPVVSQSAPNSIFSEERALLHVQNLTKTARLVSHPDIEAGAQYILKVLQEIADIAAGRDDLIVEVERQQVSGGINMFFLDRVIGNAYNNLTNIVLVITSRDARTDKAVLVGAHYDSVIGSLGASDCVSQVGIMLEAARVIVSSPQLSLAAPLLFLFNGGEETFSQAAHGFMAANTRPLGAFINLESTGPGGPDYLFQHAGGWTAAAYARAAKYPRGASLGQDIFDSGVLPADSDYRMFSYQHYGNLPGLDIAFLLDGAAYHTDRDSVDRIRKGTLQAMGENLLAVLPEFAGVLADSGAHGVMGDHKCIYFDILGYHMVAYSQRVAKIVHSLPVAYVIALPLLTASAVAQGLAFGVLLKGATLTLASLISAVLCPALLGVLRVLALGRPMVWYGQHYLGFMMYLPAAVAGALLPHLFYDINVRDALLGAALLLGSIASLLTSAGLGSGFLPAMWALSCIVAAPTRWQAPSLRRVLLVSIPSIFVSMPLFFLLTDVLMDKTSMMGVLPPPLGPTVPDAIIGALIGASTAITATTAIPWCGTRLPMKHLRRLVVFCALLSVAIAALASSTQLPYSAAAPKRVMLQHLHVQGPDGAVQDTKLVISGSDAMPVNQALNLSSFDDREVSYRDWQTMHPIGERLGGVVIAAPLTAQNLVEPPSIRLISEILQPDSSPSSSLSGRRLQLELRTGQPCWGVLNMTGSVTAWSFTSGLPAPLSTLGGESPQIIRIAGNAGSEVWPFWVDVAPASSLHIELSVSFWDRWEPEIDEFIVEVMPDWITLLAGTTYVSDWNFPA